MGGREQAPPGAELPVSFLRGRGSGITEGPHGQGRRRPAPISCPGRCFQLGCEHPGFPSPSNLKGWWEYRCISTGLAPEASRSRGGPAHTSVCRRFQGRADVRPGVGVRDGPGPQEWQGPPRRAQGPRKMSSC